MVFKPISLHKLLGYNLNFQHGAAKLYSVKLKNNFERRISTSSCLEHSKTILYDFHVAHAGKMVDFAGYVMPVQYGKVGIGASHKHVRAKCGLFDVSHMLQTKVHGKDRIKFMEIITVADIENLKGNSGSLSLFTNENGGIIDDLICSKVECGTDSHLYVVSNAGCREKDLKHMKEKLVEFKASGGDAEIEIMMDYGLVALQGPMAAMALQKLCSFDLSKLYFMNTTTAELCGTNCRITRCGYTGEDGFEISIPNSKAVEFCENLLSNTDVQFAGLGARDSLRLEAGLCLYGNDIDEETTPIEAMLAWTISKRRREMANFPGAKVILQQIKEKPKRKRVGLVSEGPPPRSSCTILDANGDVVGKITSGCPSPSLMKNISMAYVPTMASKVGNELQVQVRNKNIKAIVTKMPFVNCKYYTQELSNVLTN